MFCKKFDIFLDAVNNEINIDRNLLKRLGRVELTFTPLRGLKSLKYIDKYNISNFIYGVLAFVFCIISPAYFLIKMLKAISARNEQMRSEIIVPKRVVLVANGRVMHLIKRLNLGEAVGYLNTNQPNNQNICHVYRFLGVREYLYAYFHAIISVFYLLWKLEDKKDILQVYVAYQWFLVYLALSKKKDDIETLYFANHYDRWAVMFDQVFADKNIVLVQHGILPENLILGYKLKNLSKVFAFNDSSVEIFKKMFDCSHTKFEKLDISLSLVEVNRERKTILIIGQPQSMNIEIEIAKTLSNDFDVFVKPHPLYDSSEYRKLDHLIVIDDVGFYPKVDLVLCYESTLGYEYEASDVRVVWWKGVDFNEIILQVKSSLKVSVKS